MKSLPPEKFSPTRWTLVLRAGGESEDSKSALRELCEIYYAPVCEFIRHWRRHPDAESARDEAHGFFEKILQRDHLGNPDPARGRFRTYLLGAVKNFLAVSDRADKAEKRGGGKNHESLDDFEIPAADEGDRRFDRAWALAVIARGLAALEKACAAAGKAEQFRVLSPWLNGALPNRTQQESADELGLSATAVKVAIHRLRGKFREAIRREVASTLDDASQLDAEIEYLIEILSAAD